MPAGGARNNKALVWNGKEYSSIREMAKELNTNSDYIRRRLARDIPIEGHYIDYKL